MTLARVYVHPSCSWVTSVELSNHLHNSQFSPSFHVNKNGGTHCIFLNRILSLSLSLVFLLLLLTHCIFVKNRFVSFQDMTSVVSSHCNWSLGIQEHLHRRRFNKIPWSGYFSPHFPSKRLISYYNQQLGGNYYQSVRRRWPVFSSAVDDVNDNDPDDSEDGKNKEESTKGEFEGVNGEVVRENLERMVGTDDSAFSGLDLATLIRNKYGRSYDVQLIKRNSWEEISLL
ncbi:hypothetical protein LWI29_013249 [Acer saccharum]|uniref:Uncharacterized protein n=1 Tax=Acer saccharum TaxID=4024 RepID=A0AA39RJU9_ACESA|nr:hypothetical protein LWI29_013249 [Acer saccharum]